MGLIDLFRPKWKHSNPDVRLAAVEELDTDSNALSEVASRDADPRLRTAALRRIEDPQLLSRLGTEERDEAVKRFVQAEVRRRWLALALDAETVGAARNALDALDEAGLVECARNAKSAAVAEAALGAVKDDKALAEVARQAKDVNIQRAAAERISDPSQLRAVVLSDAKEATRLICVARLSDRGQLDLILKNTRSKPVKKAVRTQLDTLPPLVATPSPEKSAAQRKARQRQLCARAEAAWAHEDLDEARSELETVEAEWEALGVQSGDDEQRLRFHRALSLFAERLKRERPSLAPVATTPAAALTKETKAAEPAPAAEPTEAERAQVAALAQRDAERLAAQAAKAAARATEEAARAEAAAARQAEKTAADEGKLGRLETLAREIEALLQSESAEPSAEPTEGENKPTPVKEEVNDRALANQLRRLDDERKQMGAIGTPALRPRVTAVQARLDAARQKIVVLQAERREAEDWRRWANVPKLEALCVKVEALLVAVMESSDETLRPAQSEQLRALQSEWKQVGPAPKLKSEALWARFKKTADEVYARSRGQAVVPEGDLAANLVKKTELADRAVVLAESSEWKASADAIKTLQKEWKEIGPTARADGDAVWKRFRAACDKFFARQKEHFGELDGDRAQNKTRKEELCVEAVELAKSSDWKMAGDRLKQLQREWKSTGPVPRADGDELWTRFRAACDQFFARQKEHFGHADEERTDNLRKKELLCEKAEALAQADDAVVLDDNSQRQVRALQADWKKIGPAPRDHAEAVWKRFRTALDTFFERKRVEEKGPPIEELPPEVQATLGVGGFANKLNLDGVLKAEKPQKDKPAKKEPKTKVEKKVESPNLELPLPKPAEAAPRQAAPDAQTAKVVAPVVPAAPIAAAAPAEKPAPRATAVPTAVNDAPTAKVADLPPAEADKVEAAKAETAKVDSPLAAPVVDGWGDES